MKKIKNIELERIVDLAINVNQARFASKFQRGLSEVVLIIASRIVARERAEKRKQRRTK